MQMNADYLVADYPVASTALVAAVATLVYAGLQLALDGAVAPVETAMFVVVFTAVYVGGTWFLRKRQEAEDGDGASADVDLATADADAASADPATADADVADGTTRDAPE